MTVYAMLAHTQPHLVRRIARSVAPHTVVIHLDRTVDQESFERVVNSTNAVFLPDRQRRNVRWAGFSQVEAMFAVAEVAMEIATQNEYIIMCSGQDYPIRPTAELETYLTSQAPRQHIRYFSIDNSAPMYERQIMRRHFRDLEVIRSARRGSSADKINNLSRRGLSFVSRASRPRRPSGVTDIAFGSSWFALTGECMRDVLANRSEELDRYFRYTFSPDEKYFHTLVSLTRHHNHTPHGGFEPYQGPGTFRLANLHHVHPSLSKWYTLDDWDEVVGSRKFFLRKVRLPDSEGLLERIDKHLLA